MRYSELADVYEELESTAKKLEKSDIIAKLLKKTPAKILPDVVLLLQGKVYPEWSEEVLGVAGQLMIRAIAKATGESAEDVMDIFTKKGDLGLTVEDLSKQKKQRTLFSEELTIEKVFENLKQIAKQAGAGSQDKKQMLIAELIAHAKPKEAKYIVRTVLEELRVGVAEGLVRDAIAKAFGVEPKVVEDAWFLRPDYGEIAEIAKEKGEAGLKKVKIEVGMPIHVLLAEKSPDLKTAVESYDKVLLEYKYDGMRTLIHKQGNKIWIFTRRLENVTAAFPDLVKLCKENIMARECILDSETIGVDKNGKPVPFQLLSTRIKRKHEIEASVGKIPIISNLFDIIYLNGEILFDEPLWKRKEILEKSITEKKGKFHIAEGLVTKDLEKAEKFYKEALKAGQEGLIVKNLDAKYQPGRRVAGGWLKVKPVMESLDLVIVGATWGAGKRAGTLGSFFLALRDPSTGKFLECGMMGSGVKEKRSEAMEASEMTLKELTKELKPLIEFEKGNTVKIKPKIIVEVAYEEIQKSPTYESGYALRFPRLVKMRPDKALEEVDTKTRIKRLYEQQKGKKR